MKRLASIFLILAASVPASRADDNDIAFQLMRQERYAEAAEIFTDPAWKGAALYKSGQWWRAAEAFVRANDPVSLYNLGNAYARLGYHALALEAYLGAAARDPENRDALANADLMREILDAADNKGGQAGLSPKEREIERRETEKEQEGGGEPEAGNDQQQDTEEGQQAENGDRTADDESDGGSQAQSSGDGKERGEEENAAAASSVASEGAPDSQSDDRDLSGGSKAAEEATDEAAAGRRARLETAQATEQWLNQIDDDPARFLEKRIALEMRRRSANGTLPEEADDPW